MVLHILNFLSNYCIFSLHRAVSGRFTFQLSAKNEEQTSEGKERRREGGSSEREKGRCYTGICVVTRPLGDLSTENAGEAWAPITLLQGLDCLQQHRPSGTPNKHSDT